MNRGVTKEAAEIKTRIIFVQAGKRKESDLNPET
jgi:hypothetical protein